MDIDVFPNSVEYWGPTGMAFFRNVQVRWMPIQGDTRFTIALERPGATADQGDYADRIELAGRRQAASRCRISRRTTAWGRLGPRPARRYPAPDEVGRPQRPTSSTCPAAPPAGASTSARTSSSASDVARASVVFGEGDPELHERRAGGRRHRINPGNPVTPIVGEALPIVGIMAFVDLNWNES